MRVLHVAPFVSIRAGGVPAFVAEAATALADLGVESTIVASNLGEPPTVRRPRRMLDDEYPINRNGFALEVFPVRPPRGLLYSPELAEYLDRATDFDLIHIHSLWMHMHYVAGRVARRGGIPLVISPHGTLDPMLLSHRRIPKLVMQRLWQNRMLEHSQLIHVTSEDERLQVEGVAPSVPRSVVPCGINFADFSSAGDGSRFRVRHGLSDNAPLIVFVGRITFKKRLDVLIDSFAKASEEHPSALLAIVGPDDENLRGDLERRARSHGILERVQFTGPLFGLDRSDALAAADVWALTSQTENFGIAVIEAMAAGCAVVASRGVSIAEELDEAGGLLAVDLEPEQIGSAISELLADTSKRSALTERAIGIAAQYDWTVIAPHLKASYEEALDA